MNNKLKTILGIFILGIFLVTNYQLTESKEGELNIDLTNIYKSANADVEIDIGWGDYFCRCKNDNCEEGSYISFREKCYQSSTPVICSLSGTCW